MLSLELSAIDVSLAIAIFILILLYMKQNANQPSKQQLSPKVQRTLNEPEIGSITSKEKHASRRSEEESQECTYYFGYLKTDIRVRNKEIKSKPFLMT